MTQYKSSSSLLLCHLPCKKINSPNNREKVIENAIAIVVDHIFINQNICFEELVSIKKNTIASNETNR